MSRPGPSLSDHAIRQLSGLCHQLGTADVRTATSMLGDILGPAGNRALTEPPLWPSGVADDHTPVEFSIALDHHARPPTLRLLAETVASEPSGPANQRAALDLLTSWTGRHRLCLDQFDRVRDLFLPKDSQGRFALWYSLVCHRTGTPAVKVYLDPTARGAERAGDLIAEGLDRLGLGGAYATILAHGTRGGRFGAADWPIFFAVDLHDAATARVKVYVAHEAATSGDAVRAAGAAGIDGTEIAAFCDLAGGGPGPYSARPLISAYTFVAGDVDRPSGYSLYLPIRSYVDDDGQAWRRVQAVAARYGYDPTPLKAAIAAVTGRRLADGVGLIAHVSLRLGHGEPGITVYLSSEAYAVTSPRQPAATTVRERNIAC